MQEEIHPDLKKTTITCACGEEYETVSTREDMRVEVCGKCHPFYTGKRRKSAKGGRVERFREKYGLSEEEGEVGSAAEEEEEASETEESEEKEEVTE